MAQLRTATKYLWAAWLRLGRIYPAGISSLNPVAFVLTVAVGVAAIQVGNLLVDDEYRSPLLVSCVVGIMLWLTRLLPELHTHWRIRRFVTKGKSIKTIITPGFEQWLDEAYPGQRFPFDPALMSAENRHQLAEWLTQYLELRRRYGFAMKN